MWLGAYREIVADRMLLATGGLVYPLQKRDMLFFFPKVKLVLLQIGIQALASGFTGILDFM